MQDAGEDLDLLFRDFLVDLGRVLVIRDSDPAPAALHHGRPLDGPGEGIVAFLRPARGATAEPGA